MKLLFAITLSIALLSASAFVVHAGQYGPADVTANAGQFSLGVGYFFSEQKFDTLTFDFGNVSVDVANPVLRSNQVYLEVDYGFAKNWEVYGRIGGADAKILNTNFNDTPSLFGTAGVRGVFFRQSGWTIGCFAQFNYYSDFKDSVSSQTSNMRLELKDPWDVNVGLIAQHKFDYFDLYYGPVAYWSRARAEADLRGGVVGAGTAGRSDSEDLKEDTNLGGFAGLRIPVTKQLILSVEGQYKIRVSAGGTLIYIF